MEEGDEKSRYNYGASEHYDMANSLGGNDYIDQGNDVLMSGTSNELFNTEPIFTVKMQRDPQFSNGEQNWMQDEMVTPDNESHLLGTMNGNSIGTWYPRESQQLKQNFIEPGKELNETYVSDFLTATDYESYGGSPKSGSLFMKTEDHFGQNGINFAEMEPNISFDRGFQDYDGDGGQLHDVNNDGTSIGPNLSPTETANSITSSLHSTEPSFFTAFPHVTGNSLEHTNTQNFYRRSLDLPANRYPTFDNEESDNRLGKRYHNFANYLSGRLRFMGDKNAKAPDYLEKENTTGRAHPVSPLSSGIQNPPAAKPFIKSLFNSATTKNYNKGNFFDYEDDSRDHSKARVTTENEDSREWSNFLTPNEGQGLDYTEALIKLTGNENDANTKSPKRSKKNLFTRLINQGKPVANETSDQWTPQSETDSSSQEKIIKNKAPNISESDMLNPLELNQASDIKEEEVSMNFDKDTAYSNSSAEANDSSNEKKGKWRTLMNLSTFRRNKVKPKNLSSDFFKRHLSPTSFENSMSDHDKINHSDNEKLSLDASSQGSLPMNDTLEKDDMVDTKDEIDDVSNSLSSVSNSFSSASNAFYNVSNPFSNASNSFTTASNSLSNASKRILGSKIMLKRKQSYSNLQPVGSELFQEQNGVEVEIDLQSLDLPPDTQIVPSINRKTNVRGRKENKEADLLDRSKVFLCNYCSRRFKRQEHLKRHFRSLHTYEKPYYCSICHKKFNRADNLNQHLKKHKQE